MQPKPLISLSQRMMSLEPGSNTRLDVDFPGGTLQEFVDTIRKTRPKGAANVVVMPDANSLLVPPINLVAVTVEAAMFVLEGPYTLPDGRSAEVDVSSYNIGDSPDLVLKVTAHLESSHIRSSVWNVEPALAAGQTAEELLGAVEAVLSLFSQKAEVSFHPPTRLLIARGAHEQLDLVNETIEQLVSSAERRRDEVESIRRDIREVQEELSEATGEIRIAKQTVELAATRLVSAKKMRERGDAPADVVAEAQLEVISTETQLDVQQAHRKRLQDRLDGLKEALKRWEQPRE